MRHHQDCYNLSFIRHDACFLWQILEGSGKSDISAVCWLSMQYVTGSAKKLTTESKVAVFQICYLMWFNNREFNKRVCFEAAFV